MTEDGLYLTEQEVIASIRQIQDIEFVDYGYLKMTYALIEEYKLIINHKKVYRILSENQLLMKRVKKQRSQRTWVKDLVP